MIGIIDIGSNTVRMNVYQVNEQDFHLLFSVKEMAGLASQIEANKLLKSGLNNLISILLKFKKTIESVGIEKVHLFATASLRLIDNQKEVLNIIYQNTDFEIDLLSGEQEGRFGVRGALSQNQIKKAVIVDLGGGSCEIVPFDQRILEVNSYSLGSLRLYKDFVDNLIPTKAEIKTIKKYTKDVIENSVIKDNKFKSVVGVGGTARALLKVFHYINNDEVGTPVLTLKSLKSMLNFLSADQKQAQDLLLKVVPDRVHTIIPGLAAFVTIISELDCIEMIVSNQGVREGYLIEKVMCNYD